MAGTSLVPSLALSMKVTNFVWFANPEGANPSRGSHGTTDLMSSQVAQCSSLHFSLFLNMIVDVVNDEDV